MAPQLFFRPWSLFLFLNPYTVRRAPWKGDEPNARPLPAHRRTQTQNKRTQISMLRVGFEATIPVFERAKTVHTLDRAATVIGIEHVQTSYKNKEMYIIWILIIQFSYYLFRCWLNSPKASYIVSRSEELTLTKYKTGSIYETLIWYNNHTTNNNFVNT
jgi:hypothetical protein